MNSLKKRVLMSASLLALAGSPVAYSLETLTCDDLEFGTAVTDILPQASNACREVVVKDGRPFARFNAEIVSNRGGTVRAKFKKAGGGFTEVYEFNPDQSARLRIGGQNVRWWDVSAGQQLDIYLPPDRFEIATHSDEADDFAATAAVVTTVTVTRSAELPTTASLVPLLGLLGSLFVAVGAGLNFTRRKIRNS